MNKEALKTINLNFNTGNSIILEYDAKSATGFVVRLVDVDYEAPIKNFSETTEILKKFTL
jgi:hypothetical protein